METAVIRQFFDLFQDFINICQSEAWLSNKTSPEEITNALLISQHVEKCLNKLQNKSLLDDFLCSLNKHENVTSVFLKNCLCDPPKYILQKILQSDIDIKQVDKFFTVFLNIFSEAKLEECLSHVILETASQEVLLKNLPLVFSKEKLLLFKSLLFLSEISTCEKYDEIIKYILESHNKDALEMLVMCLLNEEIKYEHARHQIAQGFLNTMSKKDVGNKKFWNLLFSLPGEYLTELCLHHTDVCKAISKALLDCGRLLKENMSSEYFYISLTYSELLAVLHKIFKNDNLKLEFLDIVSESNSELEFWNIALKS